MFDSRRIIYWKGWEYESQNGLHMIQSKRHIIIENLTACGKLVPMHLVNRDVGNDVCRKCQSAEERLEKDYEIR